MQQQNAAQARAKETPKPGPPPEQPARPVVTGKPVISMDSFQTPLPVKPVTAKGKGKLQVPTPPNSKSTKQQSPVAKLDYAEKSHEIVTEVEEAAIPQELNAKDDSSGFKRSEHVLEAVVGVNATGKNAQNTKFEATESELNTEATAEPCTPETNIQTTATIDNSTGPTIVKENSKTDSPTQNHQQSLVILISTLSQKCINLQDKVFTTLKMKDIPYEVIDAIDPDPMYNELRNDLVAISKTKEYPQFFHVDLQTGVPSFYGTYERFQNALDDGVLKRELLLLPDKDTETRMDHPIIPLVAEQRSEQVVAIDETADPQNHSQNVAPVATGISIPSSPAPTLNDIPMSDRMMEQFSEQMKRVEENHLAEMMEMESQHALALAQAQESVDHTSCEAFRQELEDRLQAQIREKDDALHELMRVNEGYQLKMDVLKREVQGTQVLLAAKDNDIGRANDTKTRAVTLLEERVQKAETAAEKAREQSKKTERALEVTKGELAASKTEHAELKARVKGVAAELKERRSECRELHARVDDLTGMKRKLEAEIENLEYQLSDQQKTGTERNDEMEQLRSEVVDSSAEIEKLRKEIAEKGAKSEKALSDYKKKAQSSLALANSRTAAAVQSKEEAELEARAARSTADSAMERAVKAEIEAKGRIKEMESQKEAALKQAEEALGALDKKRAEIVRLQEALDESSSTEKRKSSDLEKTRSELASERAKSLSLEKEAADAKVRMHILREDTSSLREQLRRAEAEARAVPKLMEEESSSRQVAAVPATVERSTERDTVLMLQQELREANNAIDDLKVALKNAIETNEKKDTKGMSPRSQLETNGSAEGSAPLFYAMEKQAELNTARSEINRLASLLSDAQSEKMEAVESSQTMRKRMEQAEARLQRYEKLHSAGAGGRPVGPGDPNGTTCASTSSTDSGAINIEYLKNIMLRYLNATTLAERKALVPVIGAVLCLTPDELNRALASLEKSVTIGGVGSSIFESISGGLL